MTSSLKAGFAVSAACALGWAFAYLAVDYYGERIFSGSAMFLVPILVTAICSVVTSQVWTAARDVKIGRGLTRDESLLVAATVRQARWGSLALAAISVLAAVLSFFVVASPAGGWLRELLGTVVVFLFTFAAGAAFLALRAFTDRLDAAKMLVDRAEQRRKDAETLLKRLSDAAEKPPAPNPHFDGYTKPFAGAGM